MTSDVVGNALGILVCLALSAFFSGAETALSAIGPARAQVLIEENGASGRALRLWIDKPILVITVILIGNNVVNITASALATQLAVGVLGRMQVSSPFVNPVSVAVGAMTLLLLTFGEITPKALARAHADRLALPAIRVLGPVALLLGPFARLFLRLADRISRMAGKPLEDQGAKVTEAEIEYLVELGGREGAISNDREKLLRGVFQFTDTTAREVMVPRTDVEFLSIDISEGELLDTIVREGHSRTPVYERNRDNIIGLLHTKDLLRFHRARKDDSVFDFRSLLRPTFFIPEHKPISEVLKEMQKRRMHMAIVVDEHGGTAGIVTMEDVLEEIFGEILDEFDKESDWFQHLPDGSWRLNARTNLADLGEMLGVTIPDDDDYDTLGGFFNKAIGSMARRGATVDAWGYRLTVEEASERRIAWVRARKLEPDGEGTAAEGDDAAGPPRDGTDTP